MTFRMFSGTPTILIFMICVCVSPCNSNFTPDHCGMAVPPLPLLKSQTNEMVRGGGSVSPIYTDTKMSFRLFSDIRLGLTA